MTDPTGAGPPGYGYGPPAYGGAGWGQAGYGHGTGQIEHPQGTTVLVLGILSLALTAVCALGVGLGPGAWVMGNSAIKEIDANPGAYSNRASVQGGRICGIIATVLLVLGVIALIAFFVFLFQVDTNNG